MFLNQMRITTLILVLSTLFFSCSPYQKALKSEDTGLKFHFADSLYNAGKYKKALKLMEQIVPAYRGTPQAEKLMFIYSNTFYNMGDYYLAGYQFERFVSSYPSSEKIEEAAYKGAKSYYFLSPRYSLDQKDTYVALDKLQAYINRFPEGEFLAEANKDVAELTNKLEKKSFEIAKQYYHIEDYKASIKSFDNFILEYPGSEFRMDAYFFRLKAAYDLALRSVEYLVPERLEAAKGYYNSFNRYYSDSERKAEADLILQDIEQRLQNKQV